MFPFGHGLGYTTFEYDDIRVDRSSIDLEEPIEVSVRITNTGRREGTEVAQLYLHQRYGATARPVRLLKGFERVSLAPGATARVRFILNADAHRYWSAATRGHVPERSVFDVWVGGSCTAALHASFTVE